MQITVVYPVSYLLTYELLFGLVRGKSLFWVGGDSVVGITTRYGDRIPVWARFFAPAQTGPGAHPASYIMGTGVFFPGG